MKPFTYHAPTTVDEAVAMLEQYQSSCAVVAGGTDVIIELNERHKTPAHVIAIDKLSELRYIKSAPSPRSTIWKTTPMCRNICRLFGRRPFMSVHRRYAISVPSAATLSMHP